MGWSESSEIICKKHPNHKQKPGVCSCCLNEKLSKVSGGPTIFSSPNYIHHQLSSPTNNHYHSSGSSSPSHSRRHHRRTGSDSLNDSSFDSRSDGGLKKSRSIIVTMRRGGRVQDGLNGKKKKEGFWSKLMKSSSGRRTKESYVHPRMNNNLR